MSVETSFAKTSSSCDASNLLSLARSYFSTPQQQTTTDTLKAMQDECAAGQSTNVVAGGWTVLSAIDTIAAAGTGGSADDGASLANGVIQYMCQDGVAPGLCTPAPADTDTVALVTAADLGSEGMFAVRGGDATDVVAHGKVPFGSGNEAFWGVQVDDIWSTVTSVPTILIYGHPETLTTVGDVTIGDLGYRLHTFPRVPGFQDGQLHVGVCYDNPVDLSGDANVLQRNGTLLQTYVPTFCGQDPPQLASTGVRGALAGMLAAAGRALLPQPLLAATLNPPATGGSPIDFSHFAPVAANPAGRLQFVTPPTDGVNGESLPTFTVEALSGGGTQIERVTIDLYLSTNNGVPAGASFCNSTGTTCSDTTAITVEGSDGYHTVATFTGVTIYKPGGYQLCARAATPVATPDGASITFQDACATIHVKNN
ncbi:MAG: hypothetical protein LJF06_01445 [Gemmatimonadetes bacterium]|nr:hypothetical protein [Gemmatimonadota bacterium]